MLANKSSSNKFTLNSLLLIYSETYPPEKTLSIDYSSADQTYLAQPLVMLTSFLGLPNTKRKSDKLTVLDVLKNMIDWDLEDEKKKKKNISPLDAILAGPMFIYHVLRMLVKLPFSIAKIFTEFLPGIGEESCRIVMENAKENKKTFKYHAARFGYGLFSTLHFIGRAITSPVKSFVAAIEKGKPWAYLSLFTSGIIYGVAGAFILGATAPLLIVLPLAVLVEKLVCISIGLTAMSAMSVALLSLIQLVTDDGIVKPLLKKIGNAIRPSKRGNDDPLSFTESTTKVFGVIPPDIDQIQSSSVDMSQQGNTVSVEQNVTPVPTIEPVNSASTVTNSSQQQSTNRM